MCKKLILSYIGINIQMIRNNIYLCIENILLLAQQVIRGLAQKASLHDRCNPRSKFPSCCSHRLGLMPWLRPSKRVVRTKRLDESKRSFYLSDLVSCRVLESSCAKRTSIWRTIPQLPLENNTQGRRQRRTIDSHRCKKKNKYFMESIRRPLQCIQGKRTLVLSSLTFHLCGIQLHPYYQEWIESASRCKIA